MSNQQSQTNHNKTITSRPNIHGNPQVSKCMTSGNMTATECSLGSFIAHPSNTLRVSKQTASGDTGDTSSSCEQPKYNIEEYHANIISSNHGAVSSARPSSVTVNSPASVGKCAPSNFNSTNGTTENKTNLIINYLPPNMTQEEVRALFSSIGEVESCKLVREKTSGESLGYAFVKFYNPTDAVRAIKTLNGLRLQNKTVKVSLARPSSDAIKGANLYICGLPRKMTQLELEKLFSMCGHIITARILYDTKTGLSRGVAFIRYDQRTEAEVAIRRLNGYVPSGANEPITVKFANSPSSNRQENMITTSVKPIDQELPVNRYNGTGVNICNTSPVSPLGDMGICPVNDPNASSANPTVHEGFPHDIALSMPVQSRQFPAPRGSSQTHNDGSTPSPDFPNGRHKVCPATTIHAQPHCNPQCIYGNLVDGNSGVIIGRNLMPYAAQGVQNSYSVPLPSVNSFNEGNTGRSEAGVMGPLPRMTGVARFKCQAATMAAAYTGGSNYRFRAPNPMLASSLTPNFPAGLPNFGGDFMRGLGPSAHALLAPAFAASSGALTATGWCIFIYNLAPDTEESILWQLFGPFGAVQTVKVVKDPITIKCKGFGFVTMSNYEEALLAIHSLNGFSLGNRVLQVSFKTTPNTRQMKYASDIFSEEITANTNLPGSLTPVPSGVDPSVSVNPPQSQQSNQDVTAAVHN